MREDLIPGFWARVDKTGDCWIWQGARDPLGYGRVYIGGGHRGIVRLPHRVSYELERGPIPEGMHLDHLCRNPSCVNPAHLEAVTPKVNIRRGSWTIGARTAPPPKTHCPHGHAMTPENTQINRAGARQCRTCRRDQGREAMRRRRARMRAQPTEL